MIPLTFVFLFYIIFLLKGDGNMIKGVIFDMDGLLVDTEMISFQCFQMILKKYNYDFELEEYVKEFSGRTLKTSIRYINEKYELDYDEEKEIEYFHELENQIIAKESVSLKEGAIELLEYLKKENYLIALATSSVSKRAENLLEKHHIIKYFDAFVYGAEVKRGKPFPDIFLKACEKLNIQNCEALVLEDSEAGIQAAYDAQIPVICIPDLKLPQLSYFQKSTAVLKTLYNVISYLDLKRAKDEYSYRCGVMDCFNEMVKAGLKKIALAHPSSTKELRDQYIPFAKTITEKYQTHYYLDDDPLVTDLFPYSLNKETYNIIFYKNIQDIELYTKLKDMKKQALKKNNYHQQRKDIAYAFGHLLGYSDEIIEKYILENDEKECFEK